MKQRCSNSNSSCYNSYGGKGITVCNEWLDFLPFKSWADANGYLDTLQIDRENNNKGYSPKNCRWVTPKQNARNRSTTKLSETQVRVLKPLIKAKVIPRALIAETFNISLTTISDISTELRYADIKGDADIIKRTLRNKASDTRKLDYQKIIHICQERIRQIDEESRNDNKYTTLGHQHES